MVEQGDDRGWDREEGVLNNRGRAEGLVPHGACMAIVNVLLSLQSFIQVPKMHKRLVWVAEIKELGGLVFQV